MKQDNKSKCPICFDDLRFLDTQEEQAHYQMHIAVTLNLLLSSIDKFVYKLQ